MSSETSTAPSRDLREIEIEVTPVPTSEDEEMVDDVFEGPEKPINIKNQDPLILSSDDNFGPKVTREELEKSISEFNQSMHQWMDRTGIDLEDVREEEPQELALPQHYSDGDEVDETTQAVLNEMDPYNPETLDDTEMQKRIERLRNLVEVAEERTRLLVEKGHNLLEHGNDTIFEELQEIRNQVDNEDSAEVSGTEADNEADQLDNDTQDQIMARPSTSRAISVTPSVKIQDPIAKSTPAINTRNSKGVRFKILGDIPENREETSPVELNFSKSPIDDRPIFFPIPPPMGPNIHPDPLSQFDRYQTTISTETDTDDFNSLRPMPILPKNSVFCSRQCLTYKRDNLIHFISRDCESVTSIMRLLTEIGAIEPRALKEKKPKIGQILVTPFKSHNIFSLVIKDKHFDSINIKVLRTALHNLKNAMTRRNLAGCRISRKGDFSDVLEPGLFSEILNDVFNNSEIQITLCYGEVELPPKERRPHIISNLHDSLIGGHKGINQTYQKIRERFYWPRMRNDILDFIRSCATCQQKKLTRTKTREPMIMTDTPIDAFDKVSIDTVGKLRMTPDGNCHMLTMQCNLTKYLMVVPIPDLRATTIADALVRHLVCQYGAPRAILSDRGTSFLSEIVEAMLRIFKIHHLTTSGYRPQTNGSLERSHAPLTDFIRTFSETYDDWDRLIPFATFTYNTSVHSATKFTPFELVFGKVARFPLRIPSDERLRTYNLFLRDLILRLGEMRVIAGNNQIKAKEKSKVTYDKKAKRFNGQIGDYAYVLNEPRVGKFNSFYNKPLKIIELLGRNNVILELPNGKKIRKHTDKLKPAPIRKD